MVKGTFFILGYCPLGWNISGSSSILTFGKYMATAMFNKKVIFQPEDEVPTNWFIVHLSKHCGFWKQKDKDEVGISLGFISFYYARNKVFYALGA